MKRQSTIIGCEQGRIGLVMEGYHTASAAERGDQIWRNCPTARWHLIRRDTGCSARLKRGASD